MNVRRFLMVAVFCAAVFCSVPSFASIESAAEDLTSGSAASEGVWGDCKDVGEKIIMQDFDPCKDVSGEFKSICRKLDNYACALYCDKKTLIDSNVKQSDNPNAWQTYSNYKCRVTDWKKEHGKYCNCGGCVCSPTKCCPNNPKCPCTPKPKIPQPKIPKPKVPEIPEKIKKLDDAAV